MPIVLILFIPFSYGLKMCICFGYNRQIFFHTFSFKLSLAVYYYQELNVLRIKFSLSLFSVSCT